MKLFETEKSVGFQYRADQSKEGESHAGSCPLELLMREVDAWRAQHPKKIVADFSVTSLPEHGSGFIGTNVPTVVLLLQ